MTFVEEEILKLAQKVHLVLQTDIKGISLKLLQICTSNKF